jgi:hypothetical protein
MGGADGSLQADRARAQLEQLRAALNREIGRLLLRLDTKPGEDSLLYTRQALATAAEVRREVLQKLLEQGGVITSLTEDQAAAAALAVAADVDLGEFAPDQLNALDRIVRGQMDEVARLLGDGAEEIATAMRVGINTGAPLGDLIEEVQRALDTTFVRAQSAVDAAIMGAGRSVTVESVKVANEGEGLYGFRLVGPLDKKTRPWCRAILGLEEPITQAELAIAVNDNGLSAEVFAGGYGCRHSWAPVLLKEPDR